MHGLIPKNSITEGKVSLEWEQALKVKAIPSAVEGGRVGLQVMKDIRKGGNIFGACTSKTKCVLYEALIHVCLFSGQV